MTGSTDTQDYDRRGHVGPFDLLPPADAGALAESIEADARKVPGLMASDRAGIRWPEYWRYLGTQFAWFKSFHIHVAAARQLGTMPALLKRVTALLGSSEVILWGAELVQQAPGGAHRWHVDVECESHGVTIWLPLTGHGAGSGLKLIDGSHGIATYPQALRVAQDLNLDSDDEVLAAARARLREAELSVPSVKPGQFLVFSGRLWHASFNCTASTRSSLVLQYSPSSAAVRIPSRFEPPLTWHEWKPPVLRLREAGTAAR